MREEDRALPFAQLGYQARSAVLHILAKQFGAGAHCHFCNHCQTVKTCSRIPCSFLHYAKCIDCIGREAVQLRLFE